MTFNNDYAFISKKVLRNNNHPTLCCLLRIVWRYGLCFALCRGPPTTLLLYYWTMTTYILHQILIDLISSHPQHDLPSIHNHCLKGSPAMLIFLKQGFLSNKSKRIIDWSIVCSLTFSLKILHLDGDVPRCRWKRLQWSVQIYHCCVKIRTTAPKNRSIWQGGSNDHQFQSDLS